MPPSPPGSQGQGEKGLDLPQTTPLEQLLLMYKSEPPVPQRPRRTRQGLALSLGQVSLRSVREEELTTAGTFRAISRVFGQFRRPAGSVSLLFFLSFFLIGG